MTRDLIQPGMSNHHTFKNRKMNLDATVDLDDSCSEEWHLKKAFQLVDWCTNTRYLDSYSALNRASTWETRRLLNQQTARSDDRPAASTNHIGLLK